MSVDSKKKIDLGFAEKCEPALLRNVYFPSKVGGKPAWLDLDLVPSTDALKCKKCGFPSAFLCQIYAPIEDKEDCFHRTIFLFICREPNCFASNSSENISAFRSQLPRQNKFYSAMPPNDDEELAAVEPTFALCRTCGCRGSLRCSRCKTTNYCSAKHQRAQWPQHKLTCGSDKVNLNEKESDPLLVFPEFEIAIEQDCAILEDSELSDDEAEEKKRLNEYQSLVEQGKAGTLSDIPESELKKYAPDDEETVDVYFRQFKKHIAENPEQVLRYDRGGEPLWITDPEMIGNTAIPPCSNCNCERQFEFQIMPQMVNFLKDDAIDWGVLAVYTCKNSCSPIEGYASEFVLKQDIISDDIK